SAERNGSFGTGAMSAAAAGRATASARSRTAGAAVCSSSQRSSVRSVGRAGASIRRPQQGDSDWQGQRRSGVAGAFGVGLGQQPSAGSPPQQAQRGAAGGSGAGRAASIWPAAQQHRDGPTALASARYAANTPRR